MPPTIDARSASSGDIRGGIMHSRLRYVLILALNLAVARVGWATCSVDSQLTNLGGSPSKCTPSQLDRLERVLNNRLQFRAALDLPLATKVLEERKCPSAGEFQAFFDAWRQLPRTGFTYTAKRYCMTTPTFYGIRFAYPDKPLDDAAASRLAVDLDRLKNEVIPALASKRAEVNGMLR